MTDVAKAAGVTQATVSMALRSDPDRAIVGSTLVELIVAQLHRHERGVPRHPKDVLVEGSWVPGG